MTTEEFLAEYPPCSCLNRSSNTKYVRQKEGQARSDPFTNQRSIAWIFISYNSSLFCKCCVQKILHTQTDCALVFVCFFLSCFFFFLSSPVDVTPVKWIFTLTLKKGSLEVVRATRQFLPNISLCCVGIGAQTTFPRSLVEVQSARNQ